MYLSQLHCYPVKSCRGITADTWELSTTGLRYDRSFMAVTAEGEFLTQREFPALAVVETTVAPDLLTIRVPSGRQVKVDLAGTNVGAHRTVTVWNDRVGAVDQGDEAATVLSSYLGVACRLVAVDPTRPRMADNAYARNGTQVGFADGFPMLLIGEASLADLNARLPEPLPMNRFRPNLVIADSDAFAEDQWRVIRVGSVQMDVVKACARCTIPTVDQLTGERDGGEPLRTLRTFRRGDRGVLFGRNLVHRSSGVLSVGDPVQVLV